MSQDFFVESTLQRRRILIFHGYLLRGTGSNIYNANLARALVRLGHEVHLFSQEQHLEDFDFVDTAAHCKGSQVDIRWKRTPRFTGRCTVYQPDIGGLLPVYVYDHYDGFEARTFPELTEGELDRYLTANIRAVQSVAAMSGPEIALANHEIMGPVILHRALATTIPYVVKAHGSALEYTVKPHARFLPYAREGMLGARAVLVGSEYVAKQLFTTLNAPELAERIRLVPPGVDFSGFVPRDKKTNAAKLHGLVEQLAAIERTGFGIAESGELDALATRTIPEWSELLAIQGRYNASGIDKDAPRKLATLNPFHDRIVAFVGKLIVSKGAHLLLCAWPLVLAAEPRAKLLIVGFGTYREALELLLRAQEKGDLVMIRQILRSGRALEGGSPADTGSIEAFFDDLTGSEQVAYLRAARGIIDSVIFTGKLDHDLLVDLLPVAEVLVVPSLFPEAFGMVAIEAVASGVWPIVTNQSGLAEVASTLSRAIPAERSALLSFDPGPGAVRQLADHICTWFAIPSDERLELTTTLRKASEKLWSWEVIAKSLIAACDGRLDELPAPKLNGK
jgi:glycosyltransferase involved in cell wall biosynthesis